MENVVIVLAWLFLLSNCLMGITVFHLILLHTWLNFNDLTTFEYLLLKREKVDLDKQLKDGIISKDFHTKEVENLWVNKNAKKKSSIIVEVRQISK
jgi:hypothetical protein